jgi:hypothetical protein
MDFQTKIEQIEEARNKYVTFELAFRNYIASGNSINGAYNFFSLEDIEAHKELSRKSLELDAWTIQHGSKRDLAPVPLADHSIISKLEKLDESISIATRT